MVLTYGWSSGLNIGRYGVTKVSLVKPLIMQS